MNLILSPASETNFKELVKYARLIKDILEIVYKKYPKAPKLRISMDDFTCAHKLRYTGEPLVDGRAAVQCTKCGLVTYIHPKESK